MVLAHKYNLLCECMYFCLMILSLPYQLQITFLLANPAITLNFHLLPKFVIIYTQTATV